MKITPDLIDELVAVLSREQIARALGISLDTLDKMHARGEGPPRFRASRDAGPTRLGSLSAGSSKQ